MSRLFFLLPALGLLVGQFPGPARAADEAAKSKKADAKDETLSDAEKTLAEKGLKWKAGKFHLEEKEEEADKAYKAYLTKIKPKYNAADKAIQKIERQLAVYQRQRDDVTSKLEAIDKSLEGFIGNQKRDELTRQRAYFGDLDSKLERAMAVLHQQMAAERDQFNDLLVERLTELQALRKKYNKIAADYRKLGNDKKAKEAVEKIQAGNGRKGELGPTDAFTKLDERIKKEENTLIPDVLPLEQVEGGSGWYLNISFGGDNSTALKKFHLDTGADGVTMSWELAKELGLSPEKSTDRRIGILASGQQATGVNVIAPMIRVGRFEVRDVEVFVFDQQYPDAASLFGIEVMNGFRWYIDPENKTLTIVEREGAQRKPARKAGG